jgi:hypothetical protein
MDLMAVALSKVKHKHFSNITLKGDVCEISTTWSFMADIIKSRVISSLKSFFKLQLGKYRGGLLIPFPRND